MGLQSCEVVETLGIPLQRDPPTDEPLCGVKAAKAEEVKGRASCSNDVITDVIVGDCHNHSDSSVLHSERTGGNLCR